MMTKRLNQPIAVHSTRVYDVPQRKDHHVRILILALLLAAVSHACAIEADVTVPYELRWYMLSISPVQPIL
jgi:hypothetical protein